MATDAAPQGQLPEADFTAMSLEELGEIRVPAVMGASKREQKITEAPSSVSIVTRQDIETYGYRTLGEILNSVRGLYVTSDRGYHFLGIRGVNRLGDYGGRTLLNINGHRLNEPIYDAAFLGYEFPLDVDLIERVEVIRGPGSSLYGNNAFFGVVNVVTRPGTSLSGKGLEGSVSYGEFESYSGRVSYGRTLSNGLELLLSGTYLTSDGASTLTYPASEATGFPGEVQRDFDGQRVGNFFGSVSYRGFTLEGLYGRRDKELPNGPYGAVFHDARNKVWDERGYVEARYEHAFENEWRLLARTYFDHYAYDGTYVNDPLGDGELVLNRDTPLARWWGGEVQLSGRWGNKHQLTLGVEGRHDPEQHQENYDLDPLFVLMDGSMSAFSVGAYAQDEFSLRPNLTLNAGVRYDYFSTFGGTVNPRAGLIWEPRPASTFKALFGQAYRAPNAYEFDFDDLMLYKANPDLEPESIRSYELVWEQAIVKHYRLTGTLFYNQIEDLITQDFDSDAADPRLVFSNTDSVDVKGGEVELEARWEHGLRARASYTFADARDTAKDQRLNNSPEHVGKLQLTIPVYPDKVFAGVELLALSSRETAYGNHVSGAFPVNLTLFGRQIVKGLDVSASIYNVLDKHSYDPAAPDYAQEHQPLDGRTFRVKLTYQF